MDAKEARRRAEQIITERLCNELDGIRDLIQAQVDEGAFVLEFNYNISTEANRILTNEGYTVSPRLDQYTQNETRISW